MLHTGGPETWGARLRGRSLRTTLIIGLSVTSLLGAACSAAPDAVDGDLGGGDSSTRPALGREAPVSGTPGRDGVDQTPVVEQPVTTEPRPTATTYRPASVTAQMAGCQMFPRDHVLNAVNVDQLPVHPRSAEWLARMGGAATPLRFPTSRIWESARGGMPFNIVDSRQTGFSRVFINAVYGNSYMGPFPLPSRPKVQGHPSAQWDRKVIVLDTAECLGYEIIQYDPLIADLTGRHNGIGGARYALDTSARPTTWTTASRLPVLGQHVLVEEARAGRVDHVIGFCSDRISPAHQWPAAASDGVDPAAMPMGTWIRLRSDVDTSSFGPGSRAVAEALRERGAVLTDTCAHRFHLFGENSADWDDADLQMLRRLSANDFEVIDPTPMRMNDDRNSLAIR
jgi:hypothetical protein